MNHWSNAENIYFYVLGDTQATLDDIEGNYTYFISRRELRASKSLALENVKFVKITQEQADTLFIGYRQVSQKEMGKYFHPNRPPPIPYPYRDQINATVNVQAFQPSCRDLESGAEFWTTYSCVVSLHSMEFP